MTTDAYFDIRNLVSSSGKLVCCPVLGCTAPLGKAPYSRKIEKPYCPSHQIRIHSHTFAYYNGQDTTSKQTAALRNILFERDYFKDHILGNATKAETHRICHENSEDAFTWNMFSRLARGELLPKLLSTLTKLSLKNKPELYLWGLKISLDDSSPPELFPALKCARDDVFEKDIKHFKTEPDIMLYVPGQLLVLAEAKFTSGNTIALTGTSKDVAQEKPKSREGILRRYHPSTLPECSLPEPPAAGPFYSQLYRNLVFAMWMANKLGVKWGVVNLVSEKQFQQRQDKVEFQDPTQFIHSCLPEKSRGQFLFYSWEQLYSDHVADTPELNDLAEYMRNKSANGEKALAVGGGESI